MYIYNKYFFLYDFMYQFVDYIYLVRLDILIKVVNKGFSLVDSRQIYLIRLFVRKNIFVKFEFIFFILVVYLVIQV